MSRTWKWVLGLAAVLVVANGVVAMVQSRERRKAIRTSRATAVRQGTRAVFNTLRRLGMDVRHEAPLTELPADCAQLWLMNRQPIAHNEMDALQSWVHSGGQLVVGYTASSPRFGLPSGCRRRRRPLP